MSDQLASLGIIPCEGYAAENISAAKPDLVIIGNVIRKENVEAQEVMRLGLAYLSMPQAIREFFLKEKTTLVIAGTHGKTTCSTMAAWLLESAGAQPGFLVGGIGKNLEKSAKLGAGKFFVVEGDEYDSSFFDKKAKFLHYHPQTLILNAVEFDHADIYKDLGQVMGAFAELLLLMAPTCRVVACWDDPNIRELLSKCPCPVFTFGLTSGAELRADSFEFGATTKFRILQKGKELGWVESPLPGKHNIKNTLAAFGALLNLGIPFADLAAALKEFQSVKKRQEILATIGERVIIDDFAHHPTAVYETLMALKEKYVGRKLWAIFEPRSNTTRRKVFQKDFVQAFKPADEIILAPLFHPEKIPEEERLHLEDLVDDLKKEGKKTRCCPIEQMISVLVEETGPQDILCFMSNGGFGGIHHKVIERLRQKK